jgi:hypothetical protein
LWRNLPVWRKQLGSSSEVEAFRVQIGDRLFVERIEAGQTSEFLNPNGISANSQSTKQIRVSENDGRNLQAVPAY